MYIPAYTEVKEHTRLIAFMKSYNFALLISNFKEFPDITPLPFVVTEDHQKLKLITHPAIVNPHWKNLDENKNVLVLFQGPHCYISPDFYENKVNVPTWDYKMVAAYEKPKIFQEREKHLNLVHSMLR